MQKRNYLTKAFSAILAVAPTLSTLEVLAANANQKPQAKAQVKYKYQTNNFSKDSDEVLMARMLFGETRGCSQIEKTAVAYSVINRVNDGKKWNGETIREVILKHNKKGIHQYSSFNEKDPNKKVIMNPERYNAKEFEECLFVARDVISGKTKDPTNGADHYYNPKVCSPDWAKKMKRIGHLPIGNGKYTIHEFYKDKN